jgi:His-Xaa-Ser system radical SAM maturase HxsC
LKLSTSGVASKFHKPIVGRVTREQLPLGDRPQAILVAENLPNDLGQVDGYRGLLTTGKMEQLLPTPSISSLWEIDHLRTGDIVAMEPINGFVRTLYRPDSNHNVIFTTQRCNSNCLMCSQPPKDRDDVPASVERNLQLIGLIRDAPKRLTITGGEPTLLGEGLLSIISALRDKFPTTDIHMLTNGRIFAWPEFTAKLAELKHPNLCLGVPLYSDDAAIHNHVVQAENAFDQTVLGLHQLARYGLRIEIRVVLHALTISRLPQLAEYIYRNLPFAEHVALMGMEHVGYAPRNMGSLWIDPHDYQVKLEEAVEVLSIRGMKVSIYNLQLCVLKKTLWKFSRKSISDWKNMYLEVCQTCGARELCGGFFQWSTKLRSNYLHALPPLEDVKLATGL